MSSLVKKRYSINWADPFSSVVWETRDAVITGSDGKEVFRQNKIEVPHGWSQLALNIVASKYFAGKLGTPERETSVRQMIHRVARKITDEGIKAGYFGEGYKVEWEDPTTRKVFGGYVGNEEANTFYRELCYILVNQMASFNSPVWFNIGAKGRRQQASACFILNVEDSMEGILNWIYEEGMIFKGGSGAGVNLSNLRGSDESLSTGGKASGPLSFMRGADASAGAIKSGGTTRRAAKMVILDADHPDILEFVRCKAHEEKKAWALGEAGYDMGLNGEAWQSIQFQNANNSVRLTDNQMQAAIDGESYQLINRVDVNESAGRLNATDLLHEIAKATWICGDPGIQFDDMCNKWHTLPNVGRQRASNPCSEYLSVDNSACNLASLNLTKFLKFNIDGVLEFDIDNFTHAVRIITTAQDILVGFSEYPTAEITRNAHAQRQLGLGYANLGAALMELGMPYDSDKARTFAAAATSLMTATAYDQGSEIAKILGSFIDFDNNREAFINVMNMHAEATEEIELADSIVEDIYYKAADTWTNVCAEAEEGYARNAQATVLAPTGTIGFMMDCQTTGIEPAIALVSYKTMVGGGYQKLVIETIGDALVNLGYTKEERLDIIDYIYQNDTIEGAPYITEADLPIFDCAFKAQNGTRSISPSGHIKMMGAVQPFLSGAISKTVNMPEEATVEDIMEAYILAWHEGVKAIAIYRDGSKRTQPLTTKSDKNINRERDEIAKKILTVPKGVTGNLLSTLELEELFEDEVVPLEFLDDDVPEQEVKSEAGTTPTRRHLPKTREAITHHFDIGGHDGYITVGLYEDGSPGEVFVTMSKQGSTLGGLMDAFAITMSIGLQYGVPIEVYIHKLAHTRFEPSGFTGYSEIPNAKSLIDYVAKFLASKFLSYEDAEAIGVKLVQQANEEPLFVTASPLSLMSDEDFDEWLEQRGPVTDDELEEMFIETVSAPSNNPSSPVARATPKRSEVSSIIGLGTTADAIACSSCGGIAVRAGTCYTCTSCGTSTGCS